MTIVPKHIIDWYDGLVTGVVTRPPAEDLWLITLIAWSPTKNLRAYGAVKISPADLRAITATGPTWAALIGEAKRIAFEKQHAVLLVVDDEHNEVVSERELTIDELRSKAQFDIAASLDSSLEQYLVRE